MRVIFLTVLATAVAYGAQAADQIVEPSWLKKPTAAMIRGVWPAAAMKAGKGGRAVIACKVSVQGTLFDCKVASETPEGMGFGSAAIAMAPQLLMKPATRNGQPFVSDVRIPINFEVQGGSGPIDTFGSRPLVAPAMAWKRAPTVAEVAAAYPAKARAADVGGVAALQCGFTADGALRTCQTMREEPKGQGFAAAARELSKLFQAFPTPPDSKPIDRAVIQLAFAFTPSMLKDQAPLVGKPTWATLPTADAIRASMPKPPAGASSARAVLECRVEQGGAVSNCVVESEEPAGSGAGASAMSVAGAFRLSTWSDEGLPVVGGKVRIPMRYQFDPAPAAPAKP